MTKTPDLEPEMVEQEVKRYSLDKDGNVCEKVTVIQVPTGRLIPRKKDEDTKKTDG